MHVFKKNITFVKSPFIKISSEQEDHAITKPMPIPTIDTSRTQVIDMSGLLSFKMQSKVGYMTFYVFLFRDCPVKNCQMLPLQYLRAACVLLRTQSDSLLTDSSEIFIGNGQCGSHSRIFFFLFILIYHYSDYLPGGYLREPDNCGQLQCF